jgi:DNA-binding response OmpR family regulator
MPHRLLLADDSVTIQRVIELTFAEEGVEVVSVGDGLEAIDRLRSEPFDIVLADVGMPGTDGFEVAAFVRAQPQLAGVAVVLLTGAFDTLDEARVAEVGAAAVLVKPFEPQMVIAKVRDLLSGRPATGGAATTEVPTARPSTSRSADDYFDRLDKAFATLNTSLEPRELVKPASSNAAPAAPEASEEPEAPEGPEEPGAPAAPGVVPVQSSPSGLADTFATLLAVEQGELPPSALLPSPRAGDDELVDRIARRVVEQLGDRAVRDLAADIVSRTAERLVREEIERIKTGN